MPRNKRRIALLLCICMILMLAVSSAYIVRESHHVCTGKGCETCIHLAEQIALLSSFALLGVAMRVLAGIQCAPRESRTWDGARRALTRTLVGWKVRLND